MNIPLVDLRGQHTQIRDEINGAMRRVFDAGVFILGEEVERCEEEFAQYCGVQYGVGASSGTTALHTALMALGVGPGDEVITTPMTYIATSAEISHAGARPVFTDIHPESFNLDVARLKALLEREYVWHETAGCLVNRTTSMHLKAVVPVHLFGQMADMGPLMALAAPYRLEVLEDAAQAHGAEYRGSSAAWCRAGSLGRAACFSFYPSKNLGACGDAGMIVTNDAALARQMRMTVNQGRSEKYLHQFEGYNYRLDALQAAILRVKMRYLDRWNEARHRAAARYDHLLEGVGDVRTPKEMPHARHVYHIYAIRTAHRDALLQSLNEAGVGAAIHYPVPCHLQPAHAYLRYRAGDFPIAERLCGEVLSLPLFPELSDEQAEYVAGSIKRFFRNAPKP